MVKNHKSHNLNGGRHRHGASHHRNARGKDPLFLPDKNGKPMEPQRKSGWFRHFAHLSADLMGKPASFFLAVFVVLAWAATGPLFHYSDTWQLVINTSTTIVTFLMVFLIQNTQNRDAKALHIKLDELIRAIHGARNKMIDLDCLSDEELADLQKQFEQLSKQKAAPRSRDRAKPHEVQTAD